MDSREKYTSSWPESKVNICGVDIKRLKKVSADSEYLQIPLSEKDLQALNDRFHGQQK